MSYVRAWSLTPTWANAAPLQLAYLSNRGDAATHGPRILPPGVYGLSNAELDTPWPKVVLGKAKLAAMLTRSSSLSWPRMVAEVLCDTSRVEDAQLPVTEASVEVERELGSTFINTTLERVSALHSPGIHPPELLGASLCASAWCRRAENRPMGLQALLQRALGTPGEAARIRCRHAVHASSSTRTPARVYPWTLSHGLMLSDITQLRTLPPQWRE